MPIQAANIYPATNPNNTDNCFQNDLAKILNPIQHNNVNVPRIQFFTEPKFSLPLPPPNDEAPTDNNENPIAVTTLAATIGVINFVQYFAKSPSRPSTIPPTSTAPTIAPYPYV